MNEELQEARLALQLECKARLCAEEDSVKCDAQVYVCVCVRVRVWGARARARVTPPRDSVRLDGRGDGECGGKESA